MGTQIPVERAPRVPQGRLWFGACAGAAAWALDGFTCFLISTQACKYGTGTLGPLGGPGVRILLAVITLAFLAVAVSGGVTAYHIWQRLSEQRQLLHAEGFGRQEFMALAGVFVSIVFAVGIIWAGLPMIWIDVCINAR